jgi:hypothetical protein
VHTTCVTSCAADPSFQFPVILVEILQAGGAHSLEKVLAGEAEDAKPEFLKQRPKVATGLCSCVIMRTHGTPAWGAEFVDDAGAAPDSTTTTTSGCGSASRRRRRRCRSPWSPSCWTWRPGSWTCCCSTPPPPPPRCAARRLSCLLLRDGRRVNDMQTGAAAVASGCVCQPWCAVACLPVLARHLSMVSGYRTSRLRIS